MIVLHDDTAEAWDEQRSWRISTGKVDNENRPKANKRVVIQASET